MVADTAIWASERMRIVLQPSRMVDVFHGTSEWAAERILKDGLRPYRDTGRVYVTTLAERAAFFAALWTSHFMERHGGRDRGAVVCFRVPKRDLIRNPDDWNADGEFVIPGGLPASAIAWHKIQSLGIDLSRPDIKRANASVQASIDNGTGGIGCPAGCRPAEKAPHRCLVETALRAATPQARASTVHGLDHWARVYETGLYLLDHVPAADQTVVARFAFLHDTQRRNDARDPGHGHRAADVVRGHDAFSGLDDAQLEQLTEACSRHADGLTTDDPTIGVCWDADRLNLWRLGRRPLPRFLSTNAARDPETIEWARELQGHPLDDWLDACRKVYVADQIGE